MAFNTLSKRFEGDFHDQLNELASKLKAKKEAQMAGAAPSPGQNPKDQIVSEVLSAAHQFNDRLVKEWLHSLQDSEIQEVKRVFDEINQLSAGEVQQLMGHSTPFDLVGGMFTSDAEEGGCTGQHPAGADAQVVTEIEIPLDNTANQSKPEGMGGQLA